MALPRRGRGRRTAPTEARWSGVGLALVAALWAYTGFQDMLPVAGEVRDPGRNIPRALLLGTLAITVIYLLVNAAFITGLGFENAREANAIAGQNVFTARRRGPGR